MPGIEKIATGILRFGEWNFTLDIRELVIFPFRGKMYRFCSQISAAMTRG